MKIAPYSTAARTNTFVMSVQKVKGGLLPISEFSLTFIWWTSDAFSKLSIAL